MTALVSVMNKHAVVIAADSAITVTTPYGVTTQHPYRKLLVNKA